MITAKIRVRTGGLEMSRSIVRSLEPDNMGMKGLTIRSRVSAENAFLTLSYDGKVETFISSLDDVLRCIQAASATLNKISGDK